MASIYASFLTNTDCWALNISVISSHVDSKKEPSSINSPAVACSLRIYPSTENPEVSGTPARHSKRYFRNMQNSSWRTQVYIQFAVLQDRMHYTCTTAVQEVTFLSPSISLKSIRTKSLLAAPSYFSSSYMRFGELAKREPGQNKCHPLVQNKNETNGEKRACRI